MADPRGEFTITRYPDLYRESIRAAALLQIETAHFPGEKKPDDLREVAESSSGSAGQRSVSMRLKTRFTSPRSFVA